MIWYKIGLYVQSLLIFLLFAYKTINTINTHFDLTFKTSFVVLFNKLLSIFEVYAILDFFSYNGLKPEYCRHFP